MLFDNKLCWNENSSSIIKRVNTRKYCSRKLRSFGVSTALLATCYNAVVCSALTFGIICWGGNIPKHEKRGRLDKIVNGQIVRICGQSTEDIYFKRLRCKLANILKDSTHPLYSEYDSRRIVRSGRLRTIMARTNRFKCSFVPSAVSVFNSAYDRT